jgi:hypothetical protein
MPNPELDKYVANRRKGDTVNNLKLVDLSVDEANLILMALAKQPFEQVAPLFTKLQKQLQSQMPPPSGAPAGPT